MQGITNGEYLGKMTLGILELQNLWYNLTPKATIIQKNVYKWIDEWTNEQKNDLKNEQDLTLDCVLMIYYSIIMNNEDKQRKLGPIYVGKVNQYFSCKVILGIALLLVGCI